MDFALRRDEPIGDGLRRIARGEVDAAVHDVTEPGDKGTAASVHDLRKRCKQLRAVARLARLAAGKDYAPANAAFRDAARQLSDVRDTQVLVEVLDGLVAGAHDRGDSPDEGAIGAVRETIVARHEAVTASLGDDPAPLERARNLLEVGWRHVERWSIDDDFDALAGGLAKTYARARRGHRRALGDATTEELHEWRKRTKYHWHQLRLLAPAAPSLVEPWAERVHDLSDLLGDDHDLAVLVDTVDADPLGHGGASAVAAVVALADVERADLQRRARSLGARVTAEPTDAVVERLRLFWEAWQHHGDEPARHGDGSTRATEPGG